MIQGDYFILAFVNRFHVTWIYVGQWWNYWPLWLLFYIVLIIWCCLSYIWSPVRNVRLSSFDISHFISELYWWTTDFVISIVSRGCKSLYTHQHFEVWTIYHKQNFSNILINIKMIQISMASVPGGNWQQISIGPDNGLVPTRRRHYINQKSSLPLMSLLMIA